MVDTNKLRGLIREKGLTIADAAKIAGVSTPTFQRRLDSGIFGTDEIDKLVDGLKIKKPTEIFFVRQ
jgi:predicted DNA-binding protein (UPF0251 family)